MILLHYYYWKCLLELLIKAINILTIEVTYHMKAGNGYSIKQWKWQNSKNITIRLKVCKQKMVTFLRVQKNNFSLHVLRGVFFYPINSINPKIKFQHKPHQEQKHTQWWCWTITKVFNCSCFKNIFLLPPLLSIEINQKKNGFQVTI